MNSDRVHEPFLDLVPKKGWLHDYLGYTIWSEGPAPFHFFVGAATMGAALGRQVYFEKGYYRLYPNLQILLVAPSGKCRKSTSCGIGIKLLHKLGILNIIQDKATPESVVSALKPIVSAKVESGEIKVEQADALGVLYAPELAVMLGKQKYNEGMITLLTSMFDSPDDFTARTKSEGAIQLKNVTLTFIGASTLDWLISAIPQDAFGGGFMSRLLFIVQEDTPRCYPIPQDVGGTDSILLGLKTLQRTMKGSMTLPTKSLEWFSLWYTSAKSNIPEDTKMAGYHERKPDHLLRLGMLLAVSEQRFDISVEDLVTSNKILTFLEKEMLQTFKYLAIKVVGQDQERLIRTLRSMGGKARHHELLKRMIFYQNAKQFKDSMQTLIESKVVDWNDAVHTYTLLEDKDK